MEGLISHSALLPLARELHCAKDKWLPGLTATGALDEPAYIRMCQLRMALTVQQPTCLFDALLILSAVQSVAAFSLNATIGLDDPTADDVELLRAGLFEIHRALTNLRTFLESGTGIDLASLGLFGPDEQVMQ